MSTRETIQRRRPKQDHEAAPSLSREALIKSLQDFQQFPVLLDSGESVTVIPLSIVISYVDAHRTIAGTLVANMVNRALLVDHLLVKRQHEQWNFGTMRNFVPISEAIRILEELQRNRKIKSTLPTRSFNKYPQLTNPQSLQRIKKSNDTESQENSQTREKILLPDLIVDSQENFFAALEQVQVPWNGIEKLVEKVTAAIKKRTPENDILAGTELGLESYFTRQRTTSFTLQEENDVFALYAASFLAKKYLLATKQIVPEIDPLYDPDTFNENFAEGVKLLAGWATHIETLVANANVGLIRKSLRRYRPRTYDEWDYVLTGQQSIITNMPMFDRTQGFKFSTFISAYIFKDHNYLSHAEPGIAFNRNLEVELSKIRRYALMVGVAAERLEREHLQELQISAKQYEDLQKILIHTSVPMSLDASVNPDDNDTTFQDILPDSYERGEEPIFGFFGDTITSSQLIPILESIISEVFWENNESYAYGKASNVGNVRLGQILARRYRLFESFSATDQLELRSLEELAQDFGVTRERIRQLETFALNRIRSSSTFTRLRQKFEYPELR